MLGKLIVTSIVFRPVAARQYVHWGKPSREEELTCAWSGQNSKACKKVRKQSEKVTLKVGDAYAVDDFLTPDEFAWLASVYKDEQLVRKSSSLNATYDRVDEVPQDLQGAFEELVQRIHGHAIMHLGSESQFSEYGWAYNGVYYPDDATLRRYDRDQSVVQAHQDSGAYGRCLSATLHTGQVSGTGGDIETYTCRTGNCSLAGWQYNDRTHPAPPPELLFRENLQTRASLEYKPGRLIYFLAETVHGVKPVEDYDRDILFIWFSCVPTFANGNIKAGHMALVRHLVEAGADVNIITPNTHVSASYFAAISGHVPILSYLHKLGAPLEIPDAYGRSPIHVASENGFLSVTRYLTNAGVDTKRPTDKGLTPLMSAAERGHLSVVAHLLEQDDNIVDPMLVRTIAEKGHCSLLAFLAKWTEANVCNMMGNHASFISECLHELKGQARKLLSCKKELAIASSHLGEFGSDDVDDDALDVYHGTPSVAGSSHSSPLDVNTLCPEELIVPESGKLPGDIPLNRTHLKLRNFKIRICERRSKESGGILAIEGLLDSIGGVAQVKEHTIPILDEEILNLLGRDVLLSQIVPQGRRSLRVVPPSTRVATLRNHRLDHPQRNSALYASVVTFLNDAVDGLVGGETLFPTLARHEKKLDGIQQELADDLHDKYAKALENDEDSKVQGISGVSIASRPSQIVNDMCARAAANYFAIEPKLGLTLVMWHLVGKRKGPYKATVGEHWHTDCPHTSQKITLERFAYLRAKFAP